MTRLRNALLCAAAAFVAIGAGSSSGAAEPMRIGVILALTGPVGPAGQGARRGIELAVEDVNQSGGIHGRQVEVVIEDDSGNPDTAIVKANELIYSKNVSALIAASTAASTVAVGGVTAPMDFPQISISGINPQVELERRCVFHVFPPQDLNVRVLLEYAKEHNFKKISLLHDSGFGAVMAKLMVPLAPDYGIELVSVETHESAANDTTSQAAKAKAAAPDAYFVIGSNAAPFRNLRQLQASQPIISAVGTATYEHVSAMGIGANNIIFTEFLAAENPDTYQVEFVEMYKAKYGQVPKNYEAAGFDAARAILGGLRDAPAAAEPKEVCEQIRGPFSGVLVQSRDFGAPDMTGIKASGYIFSEVNDGVFHRTDFRLND